MSRVNYTQFDIEDEQPTFQPMRRRHAEEGQVGRRRPLDREAARDLGRKPRSERQVARRQMSEMAV